MESNTYEKTLNQYVEGAVIYSENENITSVSLLIKGRVQVQGNGAKYTLYAGSFLGLMDLNYGVHQSTYTAIDEVVVCTFTIEDAKDMINIILSNKDYHGLAIASLCRQLCDVEKIYQDLRSCSNDLYRCIEEVQTDFLVEVRENRILGYHDNSFKGERIGTSNFEISKNQLAYYKELSQIPIDIVKDYYSHCTIITKQQIVDQLSLIQNLNKECANIANNIIQNFYVLINNKDDSIYIQISKVIIEVQKLKQSPNRLLGILDTVIDKINDVDMLMENSTGKRLNIDRKRMENIYYMLLSGKTDQVEEERTEDISNESDDEIISFTKDSLNQILQYSELDISECDKFRTYMNEFLQLNDRQSAEDNIRKLRRSISEVYYRIYEAVFIKAYEQAQVPKVIELFLRFGFLDERLLTEQNIIELWKLPENVQNGFCKVYDLKEWLTLIYENKRIPSKNEFDLDYTEYIRSLRKSSSFTEEEEASYLKDSRKKLHYEISNMFSYNNRIAHGQISIFVPFIYSDAMIHTIKKCYLNADKVNTAISRVRNIDYSIFYREVIHAIEATAVTKTYVMKEVPPELILLPIYGVNGVMWQDISTKRKDTPGRWILPILCESNLDEIITKLCGRYRWELCRSIQGSSWNNIKYKSLTSEYADYIQFYRKNRELSEDRKEKIKNQIQRGKGNTREIFTLDYELWVNSESQGAIRMNKIAREILAVYCPFVKETRERLVLQPLFEEAMERFSRETTKKVKELEGIIRTLQKENVAVSNEILETLEFYKNL